MTDGTSGVATGHVLDLTGRVAVITGGSRGLGNAMANAFADAGAHVVIASRKYDNCVAAADEIENRTGRRAFAYKVHAGRWDEAEPFLDAVLSEFGRVDVLVNNAGMAPAYETLGDVSEKMFDSVLSLNFKGPFRLSTLFGKAMKESEGGSIINISSTASIRPNPTVVPYACAKAALNLLAESLAFELGPKVRINTLMSGLMNTDIAQSWGDEAMAEEVKQTAMRRVGQPSEIVSAALLLASNASSYITGAVIRVDGGIR